MSSNKLHGYLFHSYIKAKSINITTNKSIIERAILSEGSGRIVIASHSNAQKKEAKPSLVKK